MIFKGAHRLTNPSAAGQPDQDQETPATLPLILFGTGAGGHSGTCPISPFRPGPASSINRSCGLQHLYDGVERFRRLDLRFQFWRFDLLRQDVVIGVDSPQKGVSHGIG
jgi:hypothetical protein